MSLTSSAQTKPMELERRSYLKSLFKNSSRLSEQSFEVLIDSMLNKRDDKFHGVWQPGRTYSPEEVVIYEGALWIVASESEICSKDNPPSKNNSDWKSLIIPVDDDDWEVLEEENVMWAKVIGRIGIGIGSHEGKGERPQAWLDVRKPDQGRWLLFPEGAEHTLFALLHYGSTTERSYLVTDLSLEEATWLSDSAKGFAFRRGDVLTKEDEVMDLMPAEGQIMMVIKPKRIANGAQLATLGLNVEDPEAMLDITDKTRGQLLFTPDEKKDPALTIVNLDPGCAKNYIALGVGKREAAFVSDAPDGFIFRQGKDYGEYCNEKNVGQGDLLMVVQQNPDHDRPQVGIGTDTPNARLDIKDDDAAQVLVLPEVPVRETEDSDTDGDGEKMPGTMENTVPALALLDLTPANATYLTTGIGETIAGWVTNAERGFVFRQGGLAFIDDNHQNIDQDEGKTFLAIREDGRIGMGTEDPYTQVEIVNQLRSGKFLFNLDPFHKVNPALGILNLRGSRKNYFTVGADNNHAILVTDSQYGFLFKKGKPLGTNDSEIDVNQGEPIVSIRPEGKGRVGVGKLPLDYEMDIHGLTRTFTLYQDTDRKYLAKDAPLCDAFPNLLKDLERLEPITFEWNSATDDFRGEGTQIGFRAHEVDDVFPEVVKTAIDGTQAVAYQNLVPVLVQAIKDLNAVKDDTQQQLNELCDQFNRYRDEMNERLTALEDRIRGCEDNL